MFFVYKRGAQLGNITMLRFHIYRSESVFRCAKVVVHRGLSAPPIPPKTAVFTSSFLVFILFGWAWMDFYVF